MIMGLGLPSDGFQVALKRSSATLLRPVFIFIVIIRPVTSQCPMRPTCKPKTLIGFLVLPLRGSTGHYVPGGPDVPSKPKKENDFKCVAHLKS